MHATYRRLAAWTVAFAVVIAPAASASVNAASDPANGPQDNLTAFQQTLQSVAETREAQRAASAASESAGLAKSAHTEIKARTGEMLMLEQQAEQTAETIARAAYMMGEPMTTSTLIIESIGDDVADVVSGVALFDHATTTRAQDATDALQQVTTWQNDLQAAHVIATTETRIAADLQGHASALQAERDERINETILPTSAAVGPADSDHGCPELHGPYAVSVDFCEQALAGVADTITRTAMLYAFWNIGVPYACEGQGRDTTHFDCSSLIARSFQAAGAQPQAEGAYTATTATMLSDPRYETIDPGNIAPGDLVIWDTCPGGSATSDTSTEPCTSRHVAWYLGVIDGAEWMLHTNVCGGAVHAEEFWGTTGGKYPLLAVKRLSVQQPLAPDEGSVR